MVHWNDILLLLVGCFGHQCAIGGIMFETCYSWKVIYLVSFNRMCFLLLLAINEVDVLRIWWNYYDCMSDFAFGRR